MKYCPECKKSHYSVGNSSRTLMYFQPIYKDGANINPDRNVSTTEYHCEECGHNWTERS